MVRLGCVYVGVCVWGGGGSWIYGGVSYVSACVAEMALYS